MNSRERVITALNHKEPDRVPLDIGQSSFTGISKVAYINLLDYMGKGNRKIIINDLKQQLARMDEDIMIDLGVDVRGLYLDPPSCWKLEMKENDKYYYYKDMWNIGWRMPKENGLYYDLFENPLVGDEVELIDKLNWPSPNDPARIEKFITNAKKLHEEGEYFVTVGGVGVTSGFFQQFEYIQGFEESYINLAMNPEYSDKLLDKFEEIELSFWAWFLPQAGEYIDMMVIPDDYAGQTSMIISAQMFRNHFKPRYKRLFSTIKKYAPNIKILFHSCGAVYEIIPDFIEMGVDILNPIQYTATGMDLVKLKKEFGTDLCFWGGGIDTQNILPSGSSNQISDEVKRNIEILGKNGGFVFNPIHNIQADVPPQNIITMINAVKKYGNY